jgi:hypothetical protein
LGSVQKFEICETCERLNFTLLSSYGCGVESDLSCIYTMSSSSFKKDHLSSSSSSSSSKSKTVENNHANGKQNNAQFERVINALTALTDVIKRSDSLSSSGKQLFLSNYKGMFTDIYEKLFVHARERQELDPLQDQLELCWETIFNNKTFPKVPVKIKKVVIFPGTCFEDAVGMLSKHEKHPDNLLIVLRHLKQTIKEMTPKKIQSSKVIETLDRMVGLHPQGGVIKQLCQQISEQCKQIVTEYQAEEAVKRAKEERQLEQLTKIKEPNAAVKRAMAKLSTSTLTKGNTSINSVGPPGKTASTPKTMPTMSSSSVIKHPLSSSPTKLVPASDRHSPQPEERKRPMTDEEYMRDFLKRARKTNIEREHEEERSRRIGEMEDAQAEADEM